MARKQEKLLNQSFKETSKPKRRKSTKERVYLNASLPEDLGVEPIKNMKIGDILYTEPDAMIVDAQNRCWLILHADTYKQPEHGDIKITRVEDGFLVNLNDSCGMFKWEREEKCSEFFHSRPREFSPVFSISGRPSGGCGPA